MKKNFSGDMSFSTNKSLPLEIWYCCPESKYKYGASIIEITFIKLGTYPANIILIWSVIRSTENIWMHKLNF